MQPSCLKGFHLLGKYLSPLGRGIGVCLWLVTWGFVEAGVRLRNDYQVLPRTSSLRWWVAARSRKTSFKWTWYTDTECGEVCIPQWAQLRRLCAKPALSRQQFDSMSSSRCIFAILGYFYAGLGWEANWLFWKRSAGHICPNVLVSLEVHGRSILFLWPDIPAKP